MKRLSFAVVAATLALCMIEASADEAPDDRPVSFIIESKTLAEALDEWAKQAGFQIFVPDWDRVKQLPAPRLQGTFSARVALEKLLEGSPLTWVRLTEKSVLVREKPRATPPKEAGGVKDKSPAARLAPGLDSRARDPPEVVVVTAQKRTERLQDVPISISVLRGRDLEKSSLTGVVDALNQVPGVVANSTGFGGGTQITMRGVGASGPISNGASPIGYYLDSVPLARIRDAVVPDSNAYDLERVEVLRGPQGTLYGVNAENGLVRVLTHDADLDRFEFKARTTVSATDGGGENYRGDAALNLPIVDGKFAARAVVGYQELSGWIDRTNKRDINDAELSNYRLKLKAQPTDAFSIGLTAWHSRDDHGALSYADDTGHTTARNDQQLLQEYDAYSMQLVYELRAVSLHSMTSYMDYTVKNYMDLTPFAVAGAGDFFFDTTYNFFTWSRTFSQEIVANSAGEGPWRWTAGAFYRDTDDRFVEAVPELGIRADLPDSAESYAGFGEVSRRFHGDRLQWTLGVRYFHDDVSSGQNVPPPPGSEPYSVEHNSHAATPRAVLTWYPSEDVTVYGSYSEGFRSSVPLGYTVAVSAPSLPDVNPDKLHNYEIGAKANVLDRRLSIDAAVYYIDWRKVQQTLCVPNGLGCIIALANGNSASGFGADFGAVLQPIDGLRLGISVSWNDLTFDETTRDTSGNLLFAQGERLSYSSEYTWGATADYSFPIDGGGIIGSLGVSANYSSEQISRDFAAGAGAVINTGDDIRLVRGNFAISAADDRWAAMLFVDNANNEDGVAGPRSGVLPVFNPRLRPRTIGLQLAFRF